MTAPSNRLKTIFASLEAAGYPRHLQRLLLPDWVTPEVESDDTASVEVATILAKRLGLRATSLFSQSPHIEVLRRRDTKYKRSIPNKSKNLTAATAVAVSVAETIAAACRIPFSPFPTNAQSFRQAALAEFPGFWLGLRNLLLYCWSHGVPVVYLAEIGHGVSKMDGMVVQTDERPVIVLSKNADLWAWQLFVLAHEIAHITLGHVEPGEILIDEELGTESYAMDDPDIDEGAADAFAIELLNGRPDATYRVSNERVNAATLAKASFDHGKPQRIDPGHIVLNFAHHSGNWPVGVAAAKILQGDHPAAAVVINEAMWRELDSESFSDDTLESSDARREVPPADATMTLFIDNDALLKLASYDLLDTALTMFNIRQEDIHVLATARYALLPAKDRLRHCKTDECANRLESFLAKATRLAPAGLNGSMLDALTSEPGIDPGEALMLGIAASTQDSYIITGDKRALEALQVGKNLNDVCEALAGRVLSLELLFSFLVEGDFGRVQAQVRSQPGVDKALTYAFGVSTPANLASVRAALDSYVGHLRRLTGALLHPSPTSS